MSRCVYVGFRGLTSTPKSLCPQSFTFNFCERTRYFWTQLFICCTDDWTRRVSCSNCRRENWQSLTSSMGKMNRIVTFGTRGCQKYLLPLCNSIESVAGQDGSLYRINFTLRIWWVWYNTLYHKEEVSSETATTTFPRGPAV